MPIYLPPDIQKQEAFVNPDILKWARETAHMDIPFVIAETGIQEALLIEWESGKSRPMYKQLAKLAELYQRSMSFFSMPFVPTDYEPLQDFRKNTEKPLSPASMFMIRYVQERQSWMSDFNADEDEPRLFVGRYPYHPGLDPEVVAKDILDTLEIKPPQYKRNRKPVNAIKFWIDSAERAGIYVSRASGISKKWRVDPLELKGFAIADPYAPFVYVNTADWKNAQLFTLVHELVHVWINQSSISNFSTQAIEGDSVYQLPESNTTNENIEYFCNQVAGISLIPTHELPNERTHTSIPFDKIEKRAKQLHVSTFSYIFRLYQTEQIDLQLYRSLKAEAKNRFEAYLEAEAVKKAKAKAKAENKSKGGGPDPKLLLINQNSRRFTAEALDALHEDKIRYTDFARLTNISPSQIEKFTKLL
jgi:Zn-dependent peptidase ImmA (M78 family)